MKISNNLTNVNYNSGRSGHKVEWIVIHNTANGTSKAGTAKNNTIYFKDTLRNASAHYFIDDGATIWRCVKDSDTAWHVGDGSSGSAGKKGCRNYNSIGIEVCEPANGKFTSKEVTTLRELVLALMKKYNVPASRVTCHHLVSGKYCPGYYVDHPSDWKKLHSYVTTAPKTSTSTSTSSQKTSTSTSTKTSTKTPIKYRVQIYGGAWQAEKQNGQLAGIDNRSICNISISGVKKYRVRTAAGWLPWVTGYNIKDHNNGYAGNGKPITALEIADSSAKYTVNTMPGGWLPCMVGQKDSGGSSDTYAGNGCRIEGIKITRV